MLNELRQKVEDLAQANVALRQLGEIAEFYVPLVNDLLRRLATTELFAPRFMLAGVVYHASFGAASSEPDSGLVWQAALLISEAKCGVGIVFWEIDSFKAHCESPRADFQELFGRFAPYEELTGAQRALLIPYVDSLLDRYIREVLPKIPQNGQS
jgi:hypothetical protein